MVLGEGIPKVGTRVWGSEVRLQGSGIQGGGPGGYHPGGHGVGPWGWLTGHDKTQKELSWALKGCRGQQPVALMRCD